MAASATAEASWLPVPADSDFSLQCLPWGVFSTPNQPARCGTRLGDVVVDLAALAEAGLLASVTGLDSGRCFGQPSLNAFMALPKAVWSATRARLTELLVDGGDPVLKDDAGLRSACLVAVSAVAMHLPATIGDYTDFYSSREHATNVGIMFRGPDNALQPNWLHLPVGYHGRSSTVFVTGQDVVRPSGQLQKDRDDPKQGPVFGPCKLLDFELEVGLFVGGLPPPPGTAVSMEQAEEHMFGLVLMNDWSARDIQKWEYVPLGPFTAKNFATTISPWVVPFDALEPFRCATSAGAQTDPAPLPYLQDPTYSSFDIDLTVAIQGQGMAQAEVVTRSNFRNLYWNVKQQLVHHSVTGCAMRAGDLLGSGTISGSAQDSLGSMLELCWKGSREVPLGSSGEVRKFLRDGDRVVMAGAASRDGVGRVGFGLCEGQILPAGSAGPAPTPVPTLQSTAPVRYQDFVLHGYWRSSCSWRVRVALAAKGLAYETRAVHLANGEQLADDFTGGVNPLAQVPALQFTDLGASSPEAMEVDGGAVGGGRRVTLTQSLAIIEFLEHAFAGRGGSLLPADPVQAARARQLAEVVNSGTQPLQNLATWKAIDALAGAQGVGKAVASEAIRNGLAALEALAGQAPPAPFLCGRAPTVADACLVPQLYNARRFGVDLAAVCPTLLAVEQACADHPWFVAAHPDNQPDAVPGPTAATAAAAAEKRRAPAAEEGAAKKPR